MKLRFKLMLMIVFLSLYYFLFSLVLLLGQYFDQEYRFNSEQLSQQIYNQTQINKIRFARYYYGRSNRPNINSLYALSNIVLSIDELDELDEQTFLKIDWQFNNISNLQVLYQKYYDQYKILKKYSKIARFINMYLQNSVFDHFHIICENGLALSFDNETDAQWYNNIIQECLSFDNCTQYISQFSDQISFPELDIQNEVWKIKVGQIGNQCLLTSKKTRELSVIDSDDPIVYSFLTNGSVNTITNGQLKNSTINEALQIWQNQTTEITDQLYQLVSVPIDRRQWRLIYDGMGEQRVVFFSSYYFIHPNYPTINLTNDLLKKCAMIYLQSMSLTFYLKLAGQNEESTTILVNQIIIACALHVVLTLYFWRKGVVIALSLEVPINQLIKLTKVDIKYLETQDFNLESYKDLFNNKEIRQFYEVIINYLNSIKYSNNKLLQGSKDMEEAEALIILSMSKRFYKKYNNNPAVGICANNIAKIHMRNKRYLEAMNEQEESVLIANQDLYSLQEMEEYTNQAAQPQDDQQLVQLYYRLKNNVLQKFQRQEDKKIKDVMKDLENKTKVIQSSQNGIQRRQTATQIKRYQNETTQLKSSLDSEIHLQRQSTPRQTHWLRNPVAEEKNPIREENSDLQSERLDNLGSPRKSSPLSKKEPSEEFKKKQYIIEHKIVFRKYQLACILFNYSMTKSQSTFLNESVKQFKDILDELQNTNFQDSFSIKYMRININTKKAFCFARAGQLEKAREELEDAEQLFKDLEASKNKLKQLDIQDFVDIFRDIPLEILREKLTGLKALLLMAKGEYKEACRTFVSILKAEGHYDPGFQNFIIKNLTRIFKKCDIKSDCLIKFSQQNQPKKLELIFLFDYSQEMTNEQFTLSHSMCKYVVQSLNDDSFVGLYAFNESLHEVFPLQLKGTYKKLLESTIEKILIKPGGEGKIFDALEITIASLFEKEKIEQRKQLALHLKSNQIKKYIEQEEFQCSDIEFRCKTSSPKMGKTFSGGFSQAFKQYEYDNASLNENMYKIDIDNIDEEKDEHTIRYVCIFSEGVHNYNQMQINRLKNLIEKKNIHLLIFNIANQNMNMLYLKQLSQVSSESRFFTYESEMEEFFQKLRTNDFTKRVYLEFF